jgi:WD40 repeat protein
MLMQVSRPFVCKCVALHNEGSSVFDVAFHPSHPSPPLAVSGGEDDLAFLFDTNTGKEILKLTGHTDSVVAVSFSAFFAFSLRSRMNGILTLQLLWYVGCKKVLMES